MYPCEPQGLNTDFHLFDNGFKQLCAEVFLQEY